MYKGGRYLGYDEIRITGGRVIRKGDIIETMTEDEAKARRSFEPVYENEQKQDIKTKNQEKNK